MSCDYSVWHTASPLSSEGAGELHVRLCDGDASEVLPHPGIVAFYAELTAQHPEIDDIPPGQVGNTDLCPWSVAFDRSEGHIIMCCVWPKADYVGELVSRLAAKHGLAFYEGGRDALATILIDGTSSMPGCRSYGSPPMQQSRMRSA